MVSDRRRSAVSASAIALALSIAPLAADPAEASAAALDCEPRAGGLLAPVTNGLCEVVGGATGTVDTVTGGTLTPVTGTVDKAADKVLNGVGDVPADPKATIAPTTSAPPGSPAPEPRVPLPTLLDQVCLPLVTALGCTAEKTAPTPAPAAPAPRTTNGPTRSQKDEKKQASADDRRDRTGREVAETGHGPFPVEAPAPDLRPQFVGHPEPIDPVRPRIDLEAPRADLLWPFLGQVHGEVRGPRAAPAGHGSDALGTALTTLMLLSAVFGAHVAYRRRVGTRHGDSIPFEPLPVGGGRHRLA
jgi:hypothetical protein